MSQNEIVSKVCGLECVHPLICPPVLQHIFNNLEFKDLKICRLVCQHWNVNSLLEMKKSPKIRICMGNRNIKQILNNETGFSEFQRFKLINYSLESEPFIKEFMNMPRIQHIDITFSIGMNGDVNLNLNLIDKFLSFLAENSEKLESFGLKIHRDMSRVPPTMDFGSFEINWTKCKSLVNSFVTDSPLFLPILERASQLQSLQILNGPPYPDYLSSLQNLIHTLIEFEFEEWHPDERPGIQDNDNLPRFTKLKRLKIVRRYSNCHSITIPSLPELVELYLEFDWDHTSAHPRFENSAIFPKLKSLGWNCSYLADQEDFKKFPDMFPNLKRFHTSKSGTSLHWKDLRMIEELSCSNLDDMAIIGFDPDLSPHNSDSDSTERDPYGEYADWSVIYKRGKCSKIENNPSGIHILSKLKRLTTSTSNISNASFIFGLLKCKSLRSVQLLSPSPFLTKEILEWMADELNLMNLSIEVSNRDWYSSHEANYFRQKHPNCKLVLPYYPTESSRFAEQKRLRAMLELQWKNQSDSVTN